jgi:transposase-like protein
MPRGRPSKGLDHIAKLEGEPELKERLRLVLGTLTGETTVREAARTLALSETRLHELRNQALQGALEGLGPKPPGRPRRHVPEESRRVQELEETVQKLRETVLLGQLRTEIALTMPHVLVDPGDLPEGEEKGGSMCRQERRRRERDAMRRRKIRR